MFLGFVCLGRVNDPFAVLWWAVQRVQAQRLIAGVDDIVTCTGRYNDGVVIFNIVGVVIYDDLAFAFFNTEELVVGIVYLCSDFLAYLQGHEHQLQMLSGVEHLPEVAVLNGEFFDILYETFHADAPVQDDWENLHQPAVHLVDWPEHSFIQSMITLQVSTLIAIPVPAVRAESR